LCNRHYDKIQNIPEFVVEKWAEIEMKKDSIKQDLEQQNKPQNKEIKKKGAQTEEIEDGTKIDM